MNKLISKYVGINSIFGNSVYIYPIIIYVISHIFLLFVHGIFWDDLTLFNNSRGGIMDQFYGNGWIYIGYVHLFLQGCVDNYVLLYRLIIFALGIINVIFAVKILVSLSFEKNIVIPISLLYAAIPLGYTHMTMICFGYQLGYTFHLLAILFFIKNYQKFSYGRYLIFFICQFFSAAFLTSSIMTCALMIIIGAWYRIYNFQKLSWRILAAYIQEGLKLCIYFIPCIIFWCLRLLFFLPTGVYAESNYNNISLSHVLNFPISLVHSISNSFMELFSMGSNVFSSILLVIIFVALSYAIYIICNRSITEKSDVSPNKIKELGICGILIYIFGISAYLLIGDIQVYNDMEDRHGILLTLSIPIIIYVTGVYFVKSKFKRRVALSCIITLFICESFHQYYNAFAISQKNDAIVHFFKTTELPEGNVVVIDNADFFHSTRFYSWSGLYKLATGKQDRLFNVNNSGFYDNKAFCTEAYNQLEAKPGKPTVIIQMNKDEYFFEKYVLKNVGYYYLKPHKYYEKLTHMYPITACEILKME